MAASSVNTRDLVVVSLGVALVVFFAGVSAAVAAGQTPPTALWAAGSAVSGALVGLLVPSPGQKKHYEAAAQKAAGEAEKHLEIVRGASMVAEDAPTAEAKAAEAEADMANAEAAAATATAARMPETQVAACVLAIFFMVLLGLGVVLAAGAVVPPQALMGSFKNVITAVVALASASGSALIGILAPTPNQS